LYQRGIAEDRPNGENMWQEAPDAAKPWAFGLLIVRKRAANWKSDHSASDNGAGTSDPSSLPYGHIGDCEIVLV